MHLTPTDKRIMDLLSDGGHHGKLEIHGCLNDELSSLKSIPQTISRLRKAINPSGLEVVCEYRKGKFYYRLVRLLSSPYTE